MATHAVSTGSAVGTGNHGSRFIIWLLVAVIVLLLVVVVFVLPARSVQNSATPAGIQQQAVSIAEHDDDPKNAELSEEERVAKYGDFYLSWVQSGQMEKYMSDYYAGHGISRRYQGLDDFLTKHGAQSGTISYQKAYVSQAYSSADSPLRYIKGSNIKAVANQTATIKVLFTDTGGESRVLNLNLMRAGQEIWVTAARLEGKGGSLDSNPESNFFP
jgi:hypothetical protein